MAYSYLKPDIKDDQNKPIALAGRDYPYTGLGSDSRRFEELLYSIYKHEIEDGAWKDKYDEINLLQGVRERGQDCSLHFKGKNIGLIQCKYSIEKANRISKPECSREIIKFILHYLTDKSLISDEKNFTYYFAVSFGFSEPALNLLTDFNSKIILETEIEKWTNEVIKNNEALKSLTYKSIEADLKRVLQSITVKILIPQDFDLLLNQPGRESIIKTFFEVRTIVDNKPIEKLTEEIKRNNEYSYESKMPSEKILDKFKQASFHLSEYPDSFEKVKDSHIKRGETLELYQWINSPLGEKDPIAVLVGNAGTGKTVIIKDLFIQLSTEGIPVIGIKADRYYVKNINEFENKINLEDSFEKVLSKLKVDYEKIVVIIDQIDALSQSLSIERDYIDTFNLLIRSIKNIDGVRVIISSREYDLNSDADLHSYKNKTTINVKPLTLEQVNAVLQKLNVKTGDVSQSLMKLLQTPHHLNVFCKIYNSDVNIGSIKTLHDLYTELWKQKIVKIVQTVNVDSQKCKELIYSIAKTMYEQQKLSLPEDLFIENFNKEINYLKSNGILLLEENNIVFFHQTFYDFAFAKQFVESKKSVIQYVNDSNQSLFIRSSLKMILSFLREHNHTEYINIYNSLLFSPQYRFHLKLLLINLIGYQNTPTEDEIAFFKNKIFKNKSFNQLFLETVNSNAWFSVLINNKYLDELLFLKPKWIDNYDVLFKTNNKIRKWFNKKELLKIQERQNIDRQLCSNLLIRHLPDNRDIILKFLSNIPDFEGKGQFVLRILYFLKIWDIPEALKLFEKFRSDSHGTRYDYFKILEDACQQNIDWVVKIYKNDLIRRINENINKSTDKLHLEHNEGELLKALLKSNKEKTFDFCFEIINIFITKTLIPYTEEREIKLTDDFAFWLFEYDRNSHFDGHNSIYKILIDLIKIFAQNKNIKFRELIENHIDSNSISILKLLVFGFLAKPTLYVQEIIRFLILFEQKGGFIGDSKIQYWVRQLIGTSYINFDQIQKDILNKILLSIHSKREGKVFNNPNTGEKKILNNFGLTQFKYLSAIPEELVLEQGTLKKTYLELKRKFVSYDDEEPLNFHSYGVVAPYEQITYDKMNLEQWIESFKKYDTNFKRDFLSHKGNIDEHSRAFKSEVSKRPDFFYPLIEKIISDSQIEHDYIIMGLDGLKEGKYDVRQTMKLYKEAMKVPMNNFHTMYLVWISSYFIENKSVDSKIANFLADCAINHIDPESDKDGIGSIQYGINTVRGAAAQRIVQLYYNTEFKNLIFDTLSQVMQDKTISVRSSIMPELAFLLNLDKEKTLKLFLLLTTTDNIEILKISLWSAQYISNYYFKELIPYFHKCIKIEELQPEISILLAVIWLNGNNDSYPILNQVLNMSNKAKSKMIDVATSNLFTESNQLDIKSQKLYEMFLNNIDEEIISEYNHSFLNFKPSNFKVLYPLLKKYSKSKVAYKSTGYYFDYLHKSAKLYPKECLELISLFDRYDKPDFSKNSYYDDESVKVIIAIYNTLSSNPEKNSKLIKKTLKIFDKMLQDQNLRQAANRVIENVER